MSIGDRVSTGFRDYRRDVYDKPPEPVFCPKASIEYWSEKMGSVDPKTKVWVEDFHDPENLPMTKDGLPVWADIVRFGHVVE